MRDFVHSVGMTANLLRQGEDRLVEAMVRYSDAMC